MSNFGLEPVEGGAEFPDWTTSAEGHSCDLTERMEVFGIPLAEVYAGSPVKVVYGCADATYDPYAMNGFVLSASATTRHGNLEIGFSMDGQITRAVLNGRIVSGSDAITFWMIASRSTLCR